MIPQKTKIDSSLMLSSINTNKFKSGVLTVSLCLPLTARDYLLSLLLSGVMRRGTEKHPSMAQINRHLDMLYAATVDIQTALRGETICFTLSAEMLEPRFSLDGTDISGEVIRTLAEILFTPLMHDGAFPASTVEAEKRIVRDMLAAEENDTATLASTRLKELLYRGNSREFPTLSYLLSEIMSVTSDELTTFHSKLRTCPAKIFYVGGEAPQKIADSVGKSFSGLSKAHMNIPLPRPHIPQQITEICEQREVSQGKLCLGLRTGITMPSDKRPIAIMFNELLGASPASKLFLGVRERLGLCYYCYSSYGAMTGNISIHSGIDVKNRDVAFEAIMSCIDGIRSGNISETELSAAQKSLSHSYTQIHDSPFALSSFYLVRDLFGVDETVDVLRQKVISVTRDDVVDLANKTVYDTQFFLLGTLTSKEESDDE